MVVVLEVFAVMIGSEMMVTAVLGCTVVVVLRVEVPVVVVGVIVVVVGPALGTNGSVRSA